MTDDVILVNIAGPSRREQLFGRTFVVAHATMLPSGGGVLNGSRGALRYLGEDYPRDAELWNHMPIVLRHPYKDGRPVTARTPEVLNTQGLGFVFNTKGEESLDGEAWFDEELSRKQAPKILRRVERGLPVELSTGIAKIEVEPGEGVHNGTEYKGTVLEYFPDHLAVLPDEEGACGVKHGCGVNPKRGLASKVLSAVANALGVGYSDSTPATIAAELVQDVVDEFNTESGTSISVELVNAEAKLTGVGDVDVSELTAELENIDGVDTATVVNAESGMATKAENVKFLTNSCPCYKGKETLLNGLSDADVASLRKQHEDSEKILAAVNVSGMVVNAEGKLEPKKPAEPPPKDDSLEDLFKKYPVLANMASDHAKLQKKEKMRLADKLTVNLSGEPKMAKVKELVEKPVDVLEELVTLMGGVNNKVVNDTTPTDDDLYNFFGGADGGPANNSKHTTDPYEPEGDDSPAVKGALVLESNIDLTNASEGIKKRFGVKQG